MTIKTINYTGDLLHDTDMLIGFYIDTFGKDFEGRIMLDSLKHARMKSFTQEQINFFDTNKMFEEKDAMEKFLKYTVYDLDVQLAALSKVMKKEITEELILKHGNCTNCIIYK